ncbi:MAG: DsbE family thiol:disulfide interchange protein [Proteobacteria bacterium]|nr:DsbE family thiol:disulfide interchange protein [Pseudomonadota bacterium]
MSRYLAPLIMVAIMIPVFVIGLSRDPTEVPSPLLNKPAPEFELPSLKDPARTVGSDDYAGQMALVNVWATWCVGCRQEHDYLLKLASETDIPIYGLNWRDHRGDALAWLRQLGDPYVASAFDEDARVGIDFGVYGAPETFLISPDGIVLYKHISPMTEEVWLREFQPRILAAKGSVQ